MKSFENTIQEHLIKVAAHDEAFAVKFDAGINGEKPINKCCEYIMAEVQNKAKGARCVGVTDEEVYGMAIHFYVEDNIEIPKTNFSARVSVSNPREEAVNKAAEEYQLTDVDMAEVKRKAIEMELTRRQSEERKKVLAQKEKQKEAAKGHPQLSLFD